MKNNNVEKMLEGKGDLSEAKEIMKLASDYKDPADAEIDLSNTKQEAWLNNDSRNLASIFKK